MEKTGTNVEFQCVACGLQGMLTENREKHPEPSCPRCGSEVMTPFSAREKASTQLTY